MIDAAYWKLMTYFHGGTENVSGSGVGLCHMRTTHHTNKSEDTRAAASFEQNSDQRTMDAIADGFARKSIGFGKYRSVPLGFINDRRYLEWIQPKIYNRDLAWLVGKRIESLKKAA